MKRKLYGFIAFLLLLSLLTGACISAAAAQEEADKTTPDAIAIQFLLYMKEGEHSKAREMFGAKLLGIAKPKEIFAKWKSVTKWLGNIERLGTPETSKKKGHFLVKLPVEFTKASSKMLVLVNKRNKITGFYVTDINTHSASEYEPPPYVKKYRFEEKEIQVKTGKYNLPGILTKPVGRGPFPVVVLVHGSGPMDRDETIGPNKTFKDISWGLATRGVASIRYDKRTKVYPGDYVFGLDSFTGRETTVDDAISAAKLAMKINGLDKNRVFILGHSLGGTLIPRIAKRCPRCAGFIVMAGAARPLEDLLIEQYSYIFALDGKISKKERKTLNEMEKKVENVKRSTLSNATLPSKVPQWPPSFWLYMRGYFPPKEAKKVNKPMLFLQGGRDYQVTMDDYELWKKHLKDKKNVRFIKYPKFNHLMIPGKKLSKPSEYFIKGHVGKKLIKDLARWVKTVK